MTEPLNLPEPCCTAYMQVGKHNIDCPSIAGMAERAFERYRQREAEQAAKNASFRSLFERARDA